MRISDWSSDVCSSDLYIAQPPLYKLKSGKQETYVKDDHELNEWLIGSALDNASLLTGAVAVPNETLVPLSHEYAAVGEILDRIGRRYDHHLLPELARLAQIGRAAGRVRACQFGYFSGVALLLKK